MSALECPEIECWQALFDDTLPPEQWERHERHLESCPACQERLRRAQPGGETLRRLAREMGDPTIAPADPTLTHVLEQLRESKPPDQTDLYFLRPSDRGDILGTLGDY